MPSLSSYCKNIITMVLSKQHIPLWGYQDNLVDLWEKEKGGLRWRRIKIASGLHCLLSCSLLCVLYRRSWYISCRCLILLSPSSSLFSDCCSISLSLEFSSSMDRVLRLFIMKLLEVVLALGRERISSRDCCIATSWSSISTRGCEVTLAPSLI